MERLDLSDALKGPVTFYIPWTPFFFLINQRSGQTGCSGAQQGIRV